MRTKRLVYLDHNATTPIDHRVVEAMKPFFEDNYGNPSSLHQKGRLAHKALEDARSTIAGFLGTEAVDIIFTSGGTESNNMAIKAAAMKRRSEGDHIITSSVEHPCVLETCRYLESEGFSVTYLPVDRYGMVAPDSVAQAITEKTMLVSVMHANNEVGTIQPIEDIAQIVRRYNRQHRKDHRRRIYMHTDAVQSFGKIDVDVEGMGVDLLSISAHKIYGPKGIGALYIRKGTEMAPYIHGGHHERGLRAGTEDVAEITGFAKAVDIIKRSHNKNDMILELRDRLYDGLCRRVDGIILHGHPVKRLPNTLSLSFQGVDGQSMLINLDSKGICASAGSACTSGETMRSHVLRAMHVDKGLIRSAARFSLGLTNKRSDIDYCISRIPRIIARLRSVSGSKPASRIDAY